MPYRTAELKIPQAPKVRWRFKRSTPYGVVVLLSICIFLLVFLVILLGFMFYVVRGPLELVATFAMAIFGFAPTAGGVWVEVLNCFEKVEVLSAV
jgi:hypothetical protein